MKEIYDKLDIQPRNVKELTRCAEALGLLDEQSDPPSSNQNTLPNPITSFIGRVREIDEIHKLLTQKRLVTLTGAGGTGKTRLALKISEDLHKTFPDGVYFVNLAPLNDPNMVAKAIAGHAGTTRKPNESVEDTLKRVLESKTVY